jgi:hypothetical protein
MQRWLSTLDLRFVEVVPVELRGPVLLGLVFLTLAMPPPLALALNLLVWRWWRQETKRRRDRATAETIRSPRTSARTELVHARPSPQPHHGT